MAIIEKGGYGSIKDSGGRASGNWKGMSGIKGSGGMKGMEENRKPHRHIRSFQVIILGFALLILAGSLILMLPWATRDGRGASFADALFTATSAACVTGLVVQDTATYWSGFGQAVILLLIQIGGMGVVTVAVFITSLSGRKIGLMQRSTMQDSISAPQMGGIVPDDRIYSPGNSGNGTYGGRFSGLCLLWGNGSWKRTLVCTFPFGFGVLQCRF